MRVGAGGILGRWVQRPDAVKRRLIDYSRWLNESETITTVTASVAPATSPPLVITDLVVGPDGDKVAFYASGGVDREEYEVTFTVTTTLRQVWPHVVRFAIRESSLSE